MRRGVLTLRIELLAPFVLGGLAALGAGAWVWTAVATTRGHVGAVLLMLGGAILFGYGAWASWWVWSSFYSPKTRR
jgi:predicted membrane metal-binding protein